MQYPKVPKLTVCRLPGRSTFIRPMSWTTGDEIHVIIRRTVAQNKRKVPMWWKNPVLAIFTIVFTA
jgi:hypothetical protein